MQQKMRAYARLMLLHYNEAARGKRKRQCFFFQSPNKMNAHLRQRQAKKLGNIFSRNLQHFRRQQINFKHKNFLRVRGVETR